MGAAPAALPTRVPRAVLMLLQVNVFDNDFVDIYACIHTYIRMYYVLISPPNHPVHPPSHPFVLAM